jgi:hypothetical protein
MAFPSYRAREVAPLRVGDPLFLYTTRGCFHSPKRDRGRVIGIAEATSAAEQLDAPVVERMRWRAAAKSGTAK